MREDYQAPKLVLLGRHSDIVAAGGASSDVDGTFYEDGKKFASFGTEPGPS